MRTVKAFRLLMKVYGVTAYRACATSAMRDASNGERIARKIHNKTGIRLEIIDGQQEARIVYDSHVADLLDREGTYLYVDVGGGSTEISLIADGIFAQRRPGRRDRSRCRDFPADRVRDRRAPDHRAYDRHHRRYRAQPLRAASGAGGAGLVTRGGRNGRAGFRLHICVADGISAERSAFGAFPCAVAGNRLPG